MYIGIDLGTTGCKTVMFDKNGKVLCEYNKEYDLIFKGSYVEQDANEWWRLVKEGMTYVVKETGIKNVLGISVSTQSISFVPVDKDGNTLYNAITWLDVRAKDETERIKKAFGEDKIYDITGKPCLPDYSLPKLMWFYENEKAVYNKTYKILFPLDFLNLRMCNKCVTDYTVAGGSMLYDIKNKCWSPELLEFSRISIEKLPDVRCMGDFVGDLLPEVCDECGIEYGCKVFLGGQDQKLAAIGAGINDGNCTVSFGTATAISKLTKEENREAPLFRFDDSSYISEIAVMTTGAALRWLTNTMFDGLSYKKLDEIAAESAPGANGVKFRPDLTVGGSISGLTLSTTKADVIYALYEGVSEDIAEAICKLGGADKLRVFGGGSKSQIWCEILSRVCNTPIEILETSETASLGAAILASEGLVPAAATKYVINPKKI